MQRGSGLLFEMVFVIAGFILGRARHTPAEKNLQTYENIKICNGSNHCARTTAMILPLNALNRVT